MTKIASEGRRENHSNSREDSDGVFLLVLGKQLWNASVAGSSLQLFLPCGCFCLCLFLLHRHQNISESHPKNSPVANTSIPTVIPVCIYHFLIWIIAWSSRTLLRNGASLLTFNRFHLWAGVGGVGNRRNHFGGRGRWEYWEKRLELGAFRGQGRNLVQLNFLKSN